MAYITFLAYTPRDIFLTDYYLKCARVIICITLFAIPHYDGRSYFRQFLPVRCPPRSVLLQENYERRLNVRQSVRIATITSSQTHKR